MEHFGSILFQKSGTANKQHIYPSINTNYQIMAIGNSSLKQKFP
jgi:hypothetical protein